MRTTGEKLRSMRNECGMTQTALAEAAGISVSMLRKYESGYPVPKTHTLDKLLKAMDMSHEDFVNWGEPEHKPVKPEPAVTRQTDTPVMADALKINPAFTDRTPAFKDHSAKITAVNELEQTISSLHFLRGLLINHDPYKSDIFTHLGLLESHLNELSKLTGYDGMVAKEHERRHAEIRAANLRIRELETQLGDRVTPQVIFSGLKHYEAVFGTWYAAHGFHYAKTEISPMGLRIEMDDELAIDEPDDCFADKRLLPYARKSIRMITDDCTFEFQKDQFHANLLDTDRNRRMLQGLYGTAFHNSVIHGFRSHCDGGRYYLRHEAFVPYEDLAAWEKSVCPDCQEKKGQG